MTDIILIDWISNQGFAIAVSVFLLYERQRMNVKVVSLVEELTVTLKGLNDTLNKKM